MKPHGWVSALGVCLLAATGHTELAKKGDLDVVMFKMGQGDGFLVELPNGAKLLIDGGHQPRQTSAHKDIDGFLRQTYAAELASDDHRIQIDAVTITHVDEDHYVDLQNVLRDARVKVERVFHSGISRPVGEGWQSGFDPGVEELCAMSRSDLAPYVGTNPRAPRPFGALLRDLQAAARRGMTRFSRLGRGDESLLRNLVRVAPGSAAVDVTVLNPRPKGSDPTYGYGDTARIVNANSVVLRIRWLGFEALFTGDLNKKSEADVLRYAAAKPIPLGCDLLKVPHHGSADADPAFLETARCMVAFVSSDRAYPPEAPWRHPRWDGCLDAVARGHLLRLHGDPSLVRKEEPGDLTAWGIYSTAHLPADVLLSTDGREMRVQVGAAGKVVTYPCD